MHVVIDRVARIFAVLGGGVLVGLIVITCLSIIGRSINSILFSDVFQIHLPEFANFVLALGVGPINGDFELVEAGMAFSICAFLPLCQLRNAHASVTVFTAKLPRRANQILETFISVLFTFVLCLIAAQLFQGMESKRASGQTSFLLQFPVWWGYAFALSGATMAAVTSIFISSRHIVDTFGFRYPRRRRKGDLT